MTTYPLFLPSLVYFKDALALTAQKNRIIFFYLRVQLIYFFIERHKQLKRIGKSINGEPKCWHGIGTF